MSNLFGMQVKVKREPGEDGNEEMKDARGASTGMTFTATTEFCRSLHGAEEKKHLEAAALRQAAPKSKDDGMKPEVSVNVKESIKTSSEWKAMDIDVAVKVEEKEEWSGKRKNEEGGAEDDEEMKDAEAEAEGEEANIAREAKRAKANRGMSAGSTATMSKSSHTVAGILTSEPVACLGAAAALALARQKGLLSSDVHGRSRDDKNYLRKLEAPTEAAAEVPHRGGPGGEGCVTPCVLFWNVFVWI